jgi:hypothetical protein
MFDEIGCIDVGCIYIDNCYFRSVFSCFVSREYPSLSRLIYVSLMSTLSEINIATPACFQGLLAW